MNEQFRAQLSSAASDEPVRVIVRFKDFETRNTYRSAAPGMGHTYELIPAQAAEVSVEEALTLADDPNVETVWPDLPVHTCLDVSVPHIKAPQLWDHDLQGQGIRVAVVDTGIDPDHPDFEGRIVAIADFTRAGGDGADGNGHGTHVASTVAGSGEASGGKYIGVAPEAEILSAKVLRDDGSGMTSDVMAGVEWAVEQNAHVINLSLGSDISCDGTDALSTLCDEAMNQGVVVCVAAGNAGPGAGTVGSPGCARKVITVGATDDGDQVTSFSSRGPTRDGRVKPDICFPGHRIVAARARGTSMGTPVDGFYTSASGTSMATPHAAGAAALLRQAFPNLTPEEVKQRLKATAVDLGLDGNTQGSGRADILAAYELTTQPPPQPDPEPTPGPEPQPQPGGCLTLGQARTTADGGIAREVWWILGALVVLCICVTCAAATLIALGIAYG